MLATLTSEFAIGRDVMHHAPIIGNVLSHLETVRRVMPRSEVQR
jgi:hypothetical protein